MDEEKTRLQLRQFISASRAQVFKAWTHPEWVSRWFAPGDMTVPIADVDVRVGGQYRIQMKNSEGKVYTTTGEYQEIIVNEKLVFSWGWEGPQRHESRVTVELHDKDSGTELVLTHERLESEESAGKHTQGWQGCLANLAARIDQFDLI